MRILWQYGGLNKITRAWLDKRCIFWSQPIIVTLYQFNDISYVKSCVESYQNFPANTTKSEYLTALKEIHECGDVDDSVIYYIIRHVEFS